MVSYADTYEQRGMSRRYGSEIDDLIQWFTVELQGHATFQVSDLEWNTGLDAMPKDIRALARRAHGQWLSDRRYDLSYNQINVAFFAAAKVAGVLRRQRDNPNQE